MLTSTGQIWVTGNNSYAQTGAGTGAGDAITPTQIPMPSGVTPEDIMTNPDPLTRLTIMGDDGNVWSIGSGRIGKLGTGSIEPIQPTVSRYLLPKYAEALSMHMNYNLDQSTGNESTQVIARTSAINAFGTIVFNDADDDGLQDAGEPGVNGEIVRLYEDTDNDGLPDGSVLETVTTANYMGRDGVALFDALPEGGYVLRLTIDGTDSYRSVILDSNEGGWFSDPTNLLIATSSFPVVNGSPSTDPPTTPPTPTAPNVDTPGAPSTGFRKIESLIWWSIVALCAALTLAVSIRKLSRK